MAEVVNKKFHRLLLLGLDKNDPNYLARKYYLDSQRELDFDSIKTMVEKKNVPVQRELFMTFVKSRSCF